MGLKAACRPLRVAVFGAKPIVTDSKTVIVRLERVDKSVKKEVFLWTTQKMCEMTAIGNPIQENKIIFAIWRS